MKLRNKNEIFSCYFEFEKELDDLLILKVFILINKYYPSYRVKYADFYKIETETRWEEIIAKSNNLKINDSTIVHLNVPLYFQEHGLSEKVVFVEEGIGIFYGAEETKGHNSLGIDFYANLYTNEIIDSVNGKDMRINQSKAARKNRGIMTSFLKELKLLLDAEITEYESPFYLDEKHIHMYGIREDAKLNYNNPA